jgi:hypothetical protein
MQRVESLLNLEMPHADKVLPIRGNVGIGRGAGLRFTAGRLDLWTDSPMGPFAGVFQSATRPAGTQAIVWTEGVTLHRAGDCYLLDLRASGLALATASVGSAVPLAGIDATTVNGYIYVYSGTGIGQCRQIRSVAANVAYLTRPWTVNLPATSKVQLVRPFGTRTAIHGSAIVAALGVETVPESNPMIMEAYIRRGTKEMEPLRPTTHDALNDLHQLTGGTKFFYKVKFDY